MIALSFHSDKGIIENEKQVRTFSWSQISIEIKSCHKLFPLSTHISYSKRIDTKYYLSNSHSPLEMVNMLQKNQFFNSV